MALDSTLAKTLIDRGSTYRYVRSQDGATDPYKVIEAASDLLKEGMRYITTDAAAFSDGLTKALEGIRKIPPAEFMNVLRAWMGYLANGRALSGVPYPCTPDNLAPLHGKRCWKNYQHWKRAPRVIRQAFTGSYIRPEHVFFYVKEDTGWKLVDVPRTPEGAWDASEYVGKEVCLIRDTPADVYTKGKVTSSVWSIDNPTIDEMVDACQWLMLATMDSGFLEVKKYPKVSYAPGSLHSHAEGIGIPFEVFDHVRSVLFADGWGTFIHSNSGGSAPRGWSGAVRNLWNKTKDLPDPGDFLLYASWWENDTLMWYAGTALQSDVLPYSPGKVIAAPAHAPDVADRWETPGGWYAIMAREGVFFTRAKKALEIDYKPEVPRNLITCVMLGQYGPHGDDEYKMEYPDKIVLADLSTLNKVRRVLKVDFQPYGGKETDQSLIPPYRRANWFYYHVLHSVDATAYPLDNEAYKYINFPYRHPEVVFERGYTYGGVSEPWYLSPTDGVLLDRESGGQEAVNTDFTPTRIKLEWVNRQPKLYIP